MYQEWRKWQRQGLLLVLYTLERLVFKGRMAYGLCRELRHLEAILRVGLHHTSFFKEGLFLRIRPERLLSHSLTERLRLPEPLRLYAQEYQEEVPRLISP
jgi:hypothetical protein